MGDVTTLKTPDSNETKKASQINNATDAISTTIATETSGISLFSDESVQRTTTYFTKATTVTHDLLQNTDYTEYSSSEILNNTENTSEENQKDDSNYEDMTENPSNRLDFDDISDVPDDFNEITEADVEYKFNKVNEAFEIAADTINKMENFMNKSISNCKMSLKSMLENTENNLQGSFINSTKELKDLFHQKMYDIKSIGKNFEIILKEKLENFEKLQEQAQENYEDKLNELKHETTKSFKRELELLNITKSEECRKTVETKLKESSDELNEYHDQNRKKLEESISEKVELIKEQRYQQILNEHKINTLSYKNSDLILENEYLVHRYENSIKVCGLIIISIVLVVIMILVFTMQKYLVLKLSYNKLKPKKSSFASLKYEVFKKTSSKPVATKNNANNNGRQQKALPRPPPRNPIPPTVDRLVVDERQQRRN